MSKPWNSGGKTCIHRQKDKKNKFTARIFEDRKTEKTDFIWYKRAVLRRQKKQTIYWPTHYYKRGKNKKTKRKHTKIEARKQQGQKIKAQKTKYVLYVFMSKKTLFQSQPTPPNICLNSLTPSNSFNSWNMSFMSLCLKLSVFLSKNKNEDQSSIRPSLAPFSFKLFFLFWSRLRFPPHGVEPLSNIKLCYLKTLSIFNT